MTDSINPRKHVFILVTFFIALSFALALLMVLSSTHTVQAASVAGGTNVSGPIITHTTWTVAGSPYLMTDDVTVNSGITLTIEPGVVVMSQADSRLGIDGHLQAVGLPNYRITFVALDPPQPDGWSDLNFAGGGSYLNHVVLDGWTVAVWNLDAEARIIIENSLIRDNQVHPILVTVDVLHQLRISNTTFLNNAPNRIIVYSGGENDNHLAANVTLFQQPGLDGYEVVANGTMGDGLIVPDGITLTLQSGVTMMFHGEYDGLEVNGRLRALGTITQPVTLMASPQNSAGRWLAVYVDGGDVDLAYTTVMSTEVGIYIYSLDPGSDVHIADSTFRGNVSGVFVEMVDPSANVVIKNNLFTDNTFYPLGIVATHLHQVQIINSTFLNNTPNRILIDTYKDNDSLIGNAILLPHVGLEGYEVNEFPTANSLIISDGITLTLEANVVMMLAEDAAMQVNGRLRTNGTPTQPVTITSAANTGPGEWDGIIFEGGEGDLQYTTVRYGESNIAVVSDTAVVTLTHTQVVSGLTGLTVDEGVVKAVCATFSQNQSDGIHVLNGDNPTVNIFSSSISNNGGAGLNNEGGVLVDARYNWWGGAGGPGGLGSGSGDAVWGHVSYEPWLLEPDCLPPLAETAVIYLPFVTMP